MIKIFKIIFAFNLTACVLSCSQVLQTVNLDINSEDNSVQEQFSVIEKTLTIREAKQKECEVSRLVLRDGRGKIAQPISEKLAQTVPKYEPPREYILGIGDTIAFSRLIENNRSNNEIEEQWPIVSSQIIT